MPTKTYNKCVINGTTYLDLSSDTVTADKLLEGYTAHDKNGAAIVGTATTSALVISDTVDTAGGTIRTITAQDSVYLQEKTITPTSSQQIVNPDTGYDGFSKVTVEAGGGSPTLQTITKTYTPTESQQTETITAGTGYDGIEEVDVTVNAISSSYVGSGVARKSSSDLTASGATVTAPAGYYALNATKTISSGSATPAASISGTSASVSTGTNTLTLTKAVSNTPQVSAGYISSGTAGNSNVSLTANVTTKGAATITPGTTDQTIASGTYLTGTQTIAGDADLIASNIKKNVQIFGVTGSYEGSGGGGGLTVATATATLSSTQGFIQFNNLLDQPTSFVVIAQNEITTGSPSRCATCVFDGTNLFGQNITNTSNAQVSYSSGSLNMSYNSGTLTISSSGADFQSIGYKLIYTYGGSDIGTADVQVGSGATSITFTGLEEEPSYFSCIFKSNFSTSSGYQRVIAVVYDGTDTYGMEMDSSAKYSSSHWSYSYSSGSLTISSNDTNAGGYFHQPGYYQLTYATEGSSGNYQNKTVTPSASQQIVTADSGYDALKKVTVEGDADLIASNIKNGVTIFGVTGSYEGGGSSKNVQVLQSTSRANSSSLTKVLGDLTVSKTGTYDIYWSGGRSNTSSSYTWGTRLYVNGSGYGTENTSWTNNCQTNHLSNVSLTANQKLSVYARGRSGSYYTFVPMLVIIES